MRSTGSPFWIRREGDVSSELGQKRNELVAALADEVFVVHASPGGKIEQLCLLRQAAAYLRPLGERQHLGAGRKAYQVIE